MSHFTRSLIQLNLTAVRFSDRLCNWIGKGFGGEGRDSNPPDGLIHRGQFYLAGALPTATSPERCAMLRRPRNASLRPMPARPRQPAPAVRHSARETSAMKQFLPRNAQRLENLRPDTNLSRTPSAN